jgi:carbamate kinase
MLHGDVMQQLRLMQAIIAAAVLFLSIVLAHGAEPQMGEMQADRAALEKRFQRPYSPWAESGFPRRAYWGDSHLHTGLSAGWDLRMPTVSPVVSR